MLSKVNDVLETLTGRHFAKPIRQNHSLGGLLWSLRRQLNASSSTPLEREFLYYVLHRMQDSKAQLLQDLWTLFELGDQEGGYFVEFGATDGVSLSNTWLLETRYGWTGILAEPNPAWHPQLAASRKAIIDHRCVYQKTGVPISFSVTDQMVLGTISTYRDSDRHSQARTMHKEITVETVALHDLLNEHDAPSVIDYLSIDTEGSEYDILAAYDWSRAIKCISVEHNHTANRDKIKTLLESKGYVRRLSKFSMIDDWYISSDISGKTAS